MAFGPLPSCCDVHQSTALPTRVGNLAADARVCTVSFVSAVTSSGADFQNCMQVFCNKTIKIPHECATFSSFSATRRGDGHWHRYLVLAKFLKLGHCSVTFICLLNK